MKSIFTLFFAVFMCSAPAAFADQTSAADEAMARMALRQILKKDLVPKSEYKKGINTGIRQVLGEVPVDKSYVELSLHNIRCESAKNAELSCRTSILFSFTDSTDSSIMFEYTVKPDGSVTSVDVQLAG